jgi:hypothetical protein
MTKKIKNLYGVSGLALIGILLLCPFGFADVIAYEVLDAMGGSNGYYNYKFAESTVSGVYIDPSQTNWIAWHNQETPYEHPTTGHLFVGSYTWVGVDDYLRLTITDPQGNTSTMTMDDNGSMGDPYGQQAVIFGAAADTPDVERWNWYQTHSTLDEAGLFNSFFNAGGAGEYSFTFSFYNRYTSSYGTPDVYLLVDSEQPAAVPEPTSMFLLGTGLGALGLVVYRRKRK